jgi:hypothetical protein
MELRKGYGRDSSLKNLLLEDANTPHLYPLPYTTTASHGLGYPQGERGFVVGKTCDAAYGAELCGQKAACGKMERRKTCFLRIEPKLRTWIFNRIHRIERGLELPRAVFYLGSFSKMNPI